MFFKDMVNIKSLGVYTDMHMFVTSKLPHFEINWETVVAEANITVPATAGKWRCAVMEQNVVGCGKLRNMWL